MRKPVETFILSIATAALLLIAARQPSLAGSATWSNNPLNGNWNSATNWVPATVPNGSSDVASFAASNENRVTISPTVEVGNVNFAPAAPSFNISVQGIGINLFLSGAGIMNQSAVLQSFTVDGGQSAIFFQGAATAGNLTSFSGDAPQFIFFDTSSAGSATFDISSNGIFQASASFSDASTASDATINVNESAIVYLFDFASGGNAVFTVATGATLLIGNEASGDHATATCIGGNGIFASEILFQQFASAGVGHFTAVGGTISGEAGSDIEFSSSASAANGTFVINGGAAQDLAGASVTFFDTSTAANANITANGGVDGSAGGLVIFADKSKGGKAGITLTGNAELDTSAHDAPGVTIGSLAGQGSVLLGPNTLTIGSNNQSTTFSGAIQDSGSLTKTGTGTLTLTGANTYTGLTTVGAGVLRAANRNGSATGTGPVTVSAGTLGGKGTVTGPTTIGTGSGTGAFLAPSVGSNKPTILNLQGFLLFKSDGTYTCNLSTKNASADQVVANGVTIQSGAQFDLSAVGNKKLPRGQVFTVISNTSVSPFSSAFANLGEGAIIAAGRNKFQASYVSGDGNDLTLTVIR